MFITKLFKAVVTNTVREGFRRGGVALKKGENELELDENQVQIFKDDPHMDIKNITPLELVEDSLVDTAKDIALTIASARLGLPLATIVAVIDLVELLRNDNNAKDDLIENIVSGVEQQAVDTISAIATNKIADVVEDLVADLDLSSVDEFLHPIIMIIDAMNAKAPLEKKPNVADLVFQITNEHQELENVTPTGAQRDEAWAWYKANVSVTAIDGGKEHVSPGNSENNTPETKDDA